MTIFNKYEILEEYDNDEEFLKELVELLIESLPEQMFNIKDAINQNDNVLLSKQAHKLKGAVGNFGENVVYETAFKLETIGKEGKMNEAAETFDVLVKYVEQLVCELKDL